MPAISLLHLQCCATDIQKFPGYNQLKTYFRCHWSKSNLHLSLVPHRINHPSVPNSSCLLAFLFISFSVYLTPFYFSLSFSLSLMHTFFPLQPSPLLLSLQAWSLKTSLSREEGKVLFCLISLLSLMWGKHS